jgi:hypothetical protein
MELHDENTTNGVNGSTGIGKPLKKTNPPAVFLPAGLMFG